MEQPKSQDHGLGKINLFLLPLVAVFRVADSGGMGGDSAWPCFAIRFLYVSVEGQCCPFSFSVDRKASIVP